jgi:transposase
MYVSELRDSSGFDFSRVAKTTRSHVMAWTEIPRPKYQRDGLRYASDTTDEEWALIEPHLPPPAFCGRTRKTSMREVVNAVFYIAQTGCQWRLLPKNFPPTQPCDARPPSSGAGRRLRHLRWHNSQCSNDMVLQQRFES